MDSFEARFGANSAQAEYWNSEAGRKWVEQDAAMNERLSALTAPLLERAALDDGDRVLDVGCGGGATTARIATAVGARGRVIGLDISEPLLALARDRCGGMPGVNFVNADAQVHTFGDGAFDTVVSRFGVMFFSDPPAAFGNLRRALRPGGRLAFVCWAGMADNAWFRVPLEVATRHLGPAEPPAPRAPGPLAFAEPDYVRGILDAAGFDAVRVDTQITAMTSAAPVEQQAEFYLRMGPAARLIAERAPGPRILATMHDELTDVLRAGAVDGGHALGARVHYVSGTA